MRTEQHSLHRCSDRTMSLTRVEDERQNGYLPAGVVHVPKDELRRFLKCKRVGNYLLGKSIGEGSFARVKQGFHMLTGERVAVKIIDKKQAQKDKYVAKNMRREAKILQMVCHPNVVQLLEVVETENRYYLVTELAAGGDLMDYICYRRKLGEVEVRKFIRQIVSAVHYLHRGGILHRDLKVENLLLDEDYNIKIIDFGLSNTIYGPTAEGQTMKGHCQTQCGSPAYAAPEILGHKPYGPQVDVWSIGVNMYAMLTGKLPYTAEPFHITTLYNKMKRGDMNEIPEHLSNGCKDLIRRFLTFRPEERITLEEALNHEWLCKDQRPQGTPVTFPNYLSEDVMNEDVVNHMVEKMHFKRSETIEAVVQNRPTPASCVYHLLCRKLKKYLEKHPKMTVKKSAKVENAPLPRTLPCVIRNPTDSQDGEMKHLNGNAMTASHEKVVAERVYVDDEISPRESESLANGVDMLDAKDSTQSALEVKAFVVDMLDAKDSTQSALEVKAFVVDQAAADTSVGCENLNKARRKTTVTPCVEPEKDEQTFLADEPVTPRTIDGSSCSMCSNASRESSRGRANSASGELIKINRNKASQNLSQISVETRSINGSRAPLKNTSISICSERGNSAELLCSETSDRACAEKKDDDVSPGEPTPVSTRGRSFSCTASSIPSMTPVEPVNAKVVSIPPSLRKFSGSFDQMPQSARMSLPHTKKNVETAATHYRQTSDCSVRSSSPMTSEGKSTPVGGRSTLVGSSRPNRVSIASIPPYGLCCQLIRLSNSDVHSGADGHKAQRSSDRRKNVPFGRRFSEDTVRHDSDSGSPRRIERVATQRHSVASQNGWELSNDVKSESSAHAQGEHHSVPFKMRLPLTRKSLDDVETFRRCLRRESNKSGDSNAEEPSRLSRTGGTGPTGNEPIISPRRSNRNSGLDCKASNIVSLPPAPGATPPDLPRKPLTNDIAMETTRESSRRRLGREVAADLKDHRHVPDEDYVSRLSQLRRSRQLDRERRGGVQRADTNRKESRRSSEPVPPPLLTSPRTAVIKLTHRPSRGRNQ